MLSDELGKKAISLSVQSSEISMKVIKQTISSYLAQSKNIKKTLHGQQSLKKLNKQNLSLQDIPLSSKDLRLFKRELNSYGLDYAVKKDLSKPDTFKIYFKGKDAVQIENALKDHMAKQFAKEPESSIKEPTPTNETKPSIKEPTPTKQTKPSIKERIKQAIEKSASLRKEHAKDKSKDLSISR